MILTRTGEMTLTYNIYHCSCGNHYYSLEARGLTLEEREIKVTPQIANLIAMTGVSCRSFEDAERMIKEFKIGNITDSTVRFITKSIGTQIFEDTKKKAEEIYENIVELVEKTSEIKKNHTMYIEFDGSMIRKILEKGTDWKELKLGVIFIRNKLGKIIQREYISYYGEAETFKKFLFLLAVKMGYFEMERTVILADGAHWIWNISKELFPDAIQILDYYHLKENVYEYFKEAYKNNEELGRKEAKKLMKKIDRGTKIQTILKNIPEIEMRPDYIVNLSGYLEYHQERILYKTYKKENLDIGSGVIESGNKNVVQHRMKQTGMKWLEDSVQAISTLRCLLFSNKWDFINQKIQENFPVLV